ncbi:hypothetical protein [Anaerobacterium chartisolvens]|nr:hypothetical protein [Anaerobacterium chartisolvens]
MLTEIFNYNEKTPCGEMSHGYVIRRFSEDVFLTGEKNFFHQTISPM